MSDSRRVAWRWVQEFFFEDWTLKLLALVIALGLWFGVTEQRAPATIRLRGVKLVFLLPNDMEISNDPRDEVEVTLSGSRQAFEALIVRDLAVSVDIHTLKPGERRVQLNKETVTMELPKGMSIERIEPGTVPVKLERRVEREVAVRAQMEGRPAAGYEVRGVQINPPTVIVRGPESHVKALDTAPTETIQMDGQAESFTVAQAAINIPDQKVTALDSAVSVRVEIGEQRVEKRLSSVNVRVAGEGAARVAPARVAVLLRGELSVVESLRADEVEVILEPAPDGALRPRLALPQGLEGRVELISTTPSEFSVQR